MAKFVLCACLYLCALSGLMGLVPDDHAQLLAELAFDQAEFNQSLPELHDLQKVEKCP